MEHPWRFLQQRTGWDLMGRHKREKGCSVTVEEVIRAFKCREPEKRIPVLRMELDYELALLHEAMVENDTHQIDQCKTRLRELRREMMMLEAL
jgi:hypothetical protein